MSMSNNLQALGAFTQTSSGILSQIAKFKYFPQSTSTYVRTHITSKAAAAAQYAQNVINLSIQINLNSNKLRNGIVNSQVNTEFSMKINNKWL